MPIVFLSFPGADELKSRDQPARQLEQSAETSIEVPRISPYPLPTNEPARLTAHKSVSRGTVHSRLADKWLSSGAGTCVGRARTTLPMMVNFYAEASIRRKPNPPHRRGAPTRRLRVSAAAPRVERSREQCNLRVAQDFERPSLRRCRRRQFAAPTLAC